MKMRHGWAVVAVVVLALLNACSGNDHVAPVDDRSNPMLNRPATHTVRSGDTLYYIAWRYALDYRALAAANDLSPPYRIFPGQQLVLDEKVPPVRAEEESTQVTVATPEPREQPAARAEDRAPSPSPSPGQVAASAPEEWQWPAAGGVLRNFSPSGRAHKGIDIAGDLGEPVQAAASGVVVYAGSGLVGYGNLLIVKHSDRYLSAYGHNSRLLVREGQSVDKGDHIADIGDSGTDRVRLHFEIRRDGKPIDPLQLLPARN